MAIDASVRVTSFPASTHLSKTFPTALVLDLLSPASVLVSKVSNSFSIFSPSDSSASDIDSSASSAEAASLTAVSGVSSSVKASATSSVCSSLLLAPASEENVRASMYGFEELDVL
ncbi:hypothetical protein MIMGU_mgv1a016588mg [Erythranthe guttata]|uniref:Uncharacterized protein n=1 Tax=Erythranthe guttata TaxID=4155 RepID=A0A022PWQ5_ERYGU|nr:hypothetical protein MIMGU_mgv1a016588mg [Erythranthe guttata]